MCVYIYMCVCVCVCVVVYKAHFPIYFILLFILHSPKGTGWRIANVWFESFNTAYHITLSMIKHTPRLIHVSWLLFCLYCFCATLIFNTWFLSLFSHVHVVCACICFVLNKLIKETSAEQQPRTKLSKSDPLTTSLRHS